MSCLAHPWSTLTLHIQHGTAHSLLSLFLPKRRAPPDRETKHTPLDESTLQDLIGEEVDKTGNDKAAIQKAKNKVKARLAQEEKKAAKQAKRPKKKGAAADDDDDAALETFAKPSIKKNK